VTLRDVIFEYLAEHPDGARLTDMEREFGMARIQIATALRGLIDDNKVEKRDLVYFAI
jgi:predicted DNA-binding transcriptional regulator